MRINDEEVSMVVVKGVEFHLSTSLLTKSLLLFDYAYCQQKGQDRDTPIDVVAIARSVALTVLDSATPHERECLARVILTKKAASRRKPSGKPQEALGNRMDQGSTRPKKSRLRASCKPRRPDAAGQLSVWDK